jgi:RNA polymerase sigma factor (sigma-70 family)
MSQAIADPMLSGLLAGDPQATADAFLEFEPYLRMVVRRQVANRVRAKFDSTDIVQSVWADVVDGLRRLDWTFEKREQLKALLVRMTRNRLIDRLRHERTALAREVALDHCEAQSLTDRNVSTASEDFYARELWNQMLDVCPPAHARLLEMKRGGASLDEIATRTGLHKSSVRRILYDVGRLVARLRADGGDSQP